MSKDEKLLVLSCPLCKIFLNPKENVKTKLYYPETIEEIPDSEFVIVESGSNHTGMIVLGEHITDITRECWGRILYRARATFGSNVRLRIQRYKISDHWYSYVQKADKY